MIIVQLTGGLGNQLFQYCSAKALANYRHTQLILDVSSFYRSELPDLEVERSFELQSFENIYEDIIHVEKVIDDPNYQFLRQPIYYKLIPKYKRSIFKERFFHYDEKFFNSKQNVFLKGGWQSYKYFSSIQPMLMKELKLKQHIIGPVENVMKEFEPKNTLAIHIRRGDYLRKKIILEWHGVLEKEYYIKAFKEISNKTNIEKLLYFTDDTSWVESELMPIIPGEIISNHITSNQYTDFHLMQHCKHNIIANSSFSWWAAYLNPNPNKIVVAPKKWFNKAPYNTNDLYPEGWIKV